MNEPLDARPLEAARRFFDMTLADLWSSYFALGGICSVLQVGNHLNGTRPISRSQHDVLVHALNEHFLDRDLNSPLAYSRP